MTRTKSIPDHESAHARAVLARIVREDFGGIESRAAKGVGISQSGLHEFLAENRGAGMNVLRAIADYLGVDIDVVTGRSQPSLPPLNQHRDWATARADAERQHPEIPVEYLELVGRGQLPADRNASVDGALVAGLAREWLSAEARAAKRKAAT